MAGALGEKAIHGETRPLSEHTIGELAQILGVEPQGPRLIELGGIATIVFPPGGKLPSVYIKDNNGRFKPYPPQDVRVVPMEEGGTALVLHESNDGVGSIEVRDGGRDVRVVRPEKSAQIPPGTPRPYFLP